MYMRILIINTVEWPFDENSLNSGLGGSETWCVQLSEAFVRKGQDVTVLCCCETHRTQSGVQYINYYEINNILSQEKYDLIIISRHYSNLLSGIDYYKTSDNVFVQAHDIEIYGDDINKVKSFPCFRGISTLSAFQEKVIHDRCGVNWEYMIRIGNGIDPKLFENSNFTPTNKRLLFSSDYRRSGFILKDIIVPNLVNMGITNTGVDYCSYSPLDIEQNEYTQIFGCLSKEQLYKEMSNRYCWFYPGVFSETFCITMLENIMCENDIIAPLTYGLSSVIEPFVDDVSMKHCFDDENSDEFWAAVDEAVNKINESITNHEKGEELRKELKNYVLCNYTWDRIADKWLKLV